MEPKLIRDTAETYHHLRDGDILRVTTTDGGEFHYVIRYNDIHMGFGIEHPSENPHHEKHYTENMSDQIMEIPHDSHEALQFIIESSQHSIQVIGNEYHFIDDDTDELNESDEEMFQDILTELYDLYVRKNADYGNSFGNTWRKLGSISALTRISDKVDRLISLETKDASERNFESIEDNLIDLANYTIMSIIELRKDELK